MTKMSNPLKVIDISEDSITTARELLDAATSQGFYFLKDMISLKKKLTNYLNYRNHFLNYQTIINQNIQLILQIMDM